ncbi:MAG: hypothetical protein LBU11_05805 [Zoogloeaceae bacterium]|nr:hypothetical protein [Zoogloeaceae bacterium]
MFDSTRHRDILRNPLEIQDVGEVAEAFGKLRQLETDVSPRFARLGVRLGDYLEQLPVYGENKRKGYFWLNDPVTYLKTCKWAVWQPEIYDMERLEEFFNELFPLARMLGLDIYDEFQMVYVSARCMGVPQERSNHYRFAFDPNITKPLALSKDAVKKRFLERLDEPLTERGFRLTNVIEDGGITSLM